MILLEAVVTTRVADLRQVLKARFLNSESG